MVNVRSHLPVNENVPSYCNGRKKKNLPRSQRSLKCGSSTCTLHGSFARATQTAAAERGFDLSQTSQGRGSVSHVFPVASAYRARFGRRYRDAPLARTHLPSGPVPRRNPCKVQARRAFPQRCRPEWMVQCRAPARHPTPLCLRWILDIAGRMR